MKIVLTGSLGHISKPLAVRLIAKGHEVTVISSKADLKKEIEALGAKAAIGQMEDTEFITNAFAGADAVYCMEIIDRTLMTRDDFILEVMVERVKQIVCNYKVAIETNGWLLLIHPDFLWNTRLAKSIKHYEFFDYAARNMRATLIN